jgi:NTE family protein
MYTAWILRALCCAVLSITTGCAGARVTNQPLSEYSAASGYTVTNPDMHRDLGKVQLYLMFSGGGTRAAALAYGVLKELAATTVTIDGEDVRLLDEVDLISSVSGGSFTAAYYSLHGEKTFDDFEEAFLRRDIDRELEMLFLRPYVWLKMMLTSYDRSDWAEQLYDKHIFHDATFADLIASKGPMVRINATDLAAGHTFSFVQEQFDMLCSDLTTLPVSRAVLASSSVPVVFAPTVIENRAGTCGYTEPEGIKEALADRHKSRRRYRLASQEAEYLNRDAHKYIYLIDGGVSDNLGVRGFLDQVILEGGMDGFSKAAHITPPPRALIVVVNAQAVAERKFQVGMYSYNFETIELLNESVDSWRLTGPGGTKPESASVVEVAFDNLPDLTERKYFNEIETSLTLSDKKVDRLIEVGARLFRESPDYADFVKSLQ